MKTSWCHESVTPRELSLIDSFLHDFYLPVPDAEPHKHQGPGVVGPSGRWIVSDRRSQRAYYGHA